MYLMQNMFTWTPEALASFLYRSLVSITLMAFVPMSQQITLTEAVALLPRIDGHCTSRWP